MGQVDRLGMDGEQSSYGTPKMERTNWINRRKNSFFDDSLSANYEKKQMNKRKRVVKKGGSTSVTYKNISKKRRRYFSDECIKRPRRTHAPSHQLATLERPRARRRSRCGSRSGPYAAMSGECFAV